ncbi:MAG: prepilin-type N-terminal cleavage/methylation domain-containing protein [bacterium]|nr:prepilin-type N-terminal cleavage/methylation domain-containing protein [bacterium]
MANRRGFTLIEVLVVLVIAAIVFSVLITVMGSSFEILRAGESKAKLTANARLALDYIINDISSAAYIPLCSDRDLNGWPDEADDSLQRGYREEAVWRVAKNVNDVPVIHASYFLSEAWADRLMTRHFSSGFSGFFGVDQQGTAVPKVIRNAGADRSAQWISFFRLVLPANAKMPYYLTPESDRNGDGTIDPLNTGLSGGVIQGYPEVVAVGPHKETAVATQDLWYALDGDEEYKRVRQIPISSNITRIRYEYFHEVPVYQSRATGGALEVLAQDTTDGSVDWIPADGNRVANMVPLVDHWEQRIVDVAYNGTNNGTNNGTSGLWQDPGTGTEYPTMAYKLQDQYPEGYDDNKRTGNHVAPATGMGLGTLTAGGGVGNGWSCTVFYNIDNDGDDIGDNAPIDRLAFMTTGFSTNSGAVEGGIAQIRPDMEALHGTGYWDYSLDPTAQGDFGDADGIPDGDGQPDDPIPGWWLPYVRAIRVTVVATPSSVIAERTSKSGQNGSQGVPVYYRLDSPVPYADQNRLQPLYTQKQDYVGSGSDLVLTKSVPVNFLYKATLVTDADSDALSISNGSGAFNRRRVELNVNTGESRFFEDPIGYDTQILPNNPVDKLHDFDPNAF